MQPPRSAVQPEIGVNNSLQTKMIACEQQLEEAVQFLTQALATRTKKGKKPVVLHSLRVGFRLLAMGYATHVVIAGLLHDILEKTSLSSAHLARRFGVETARIVAAVTNDTRINSPVRRYNDSLARCSACGPGALAVRAADLLDNSDRLLALGNAARLGRVAIKLRLLIDICREDEVDDRMVEELSRRLRRVRKQVGLLTLGKVVPEG